MEQIKNNHPRLHIKFIPTYEEAANYLSENAREIQKREKAIVICRGYYPEVKRSFTDIVRIFNDQIVGELPMAVYTRSKTVLLEKNPNPPRNVEIFDKGHHLLDFINKNLK